MDCCRGSFSNLRCDRLNFGTGQSCVNEMLCVRIMLVFWAFIGLAPAPAHAQACPPLRQLDEIPLVPVNGGSTELVPVIINGIDKFMVFDTGASVSSVTHNLAGQLGLSVHPALGRYTLFDAYGYESHDVTMIKDFKFGHEEIRNTVFGIWPNPNLDNVDPRLAGELSRDRLAQFDVDANFLDGTLKLFSPQHCPGKILYWKAAAVAASAFTINDGHITIVVSLNGQKLNAIIDTGAPTSILSSQAARRFFDLTANSPGTKLSAVLSKNSQRPIYDYQFSELDFNGVAVTHPIIAIWPEVISQDAEPNTRNLYNRAVSSGVGAHQPPLVIGMDILKKLHVYIAFREKRIYFSGPSVSSLSGSEH